jgi:hypothetical protein
MVSRSVDALDEVELDVLAEIGCPHDVMAARVYIPT